MYNVLDNIKYTIEESKFIQRLIEQSYDFDFEFSKPEDDYLTMRLDIEFPLCHDGEYIKKYYMDDMNYNLNMYNFNMFTFIHNHYITDEALHYFKNYVLLNLSTPIKENVKDIIINYNVIPEDLSLSIELRFIFYYELKLFMFDEKDFDARHLIYPAMCICYNVFNEVCLNINYTNLYNSNSLRFDVVIDKDVNLLLNVIDELKIKMENSIKHYKVMDVSFDFEYSSVSFYLIKFPTED